MTEIVRSLESILQAQGALPSTAWRVAPFLPSGNRMSILTSRARDRVFGHTSCWPTTSVEELGLERAEEALGHGVVPAITLAAYRAHDAVLIEHGRCFRHQECCYAAAGSGTGAEETELRALLSRKTSIRNHKGIVVAKKMSRKVSRRVVRPACIAGVRISLPNFRAPCGRTKL